jgi:potassium efflux system protein
VGSWAYASAGFYFLNVALSVTLASHLLLYRYLLITLNLLMLTAIVWLIVRTQRAATSKGDRPVAIAGTKAALLGAAAIVVVAVVSNILGNVSLATMSTSALLNSSYAAVVLFACVTVVVALARVLLARPDLARAARRRTASRAIHAAKRLGSIAVVVAWAAITLGEFRIRDPLVHRLSAILGHEFSLGLVDISLGSVVAFFGAAWIAFWVAKMVRLLLSEDILPALSLPRGVANSISTLSSYGVLLVGLLMSLAVAGYQIKQLTLVFGALGVGIGFGLQDIVKNFVSGLILMVERPIQPGDSVEVAGVHGHVREIGMRATSVTTLDGAEMIVPNGKLLADRLVNWTLVSSQRRVEINVATSFATAPQHTIELLDRLAAGVEGVAQHPPPSTLLTGLAAGALEFNVRAWTTDQANWQAVRSALAVRVRNGLAEAGVVVPAPRWTLEMQPPVVAARGHRDAVEPPVHPTAGDPRAK